MAPEKPKKRGEMVLQLTPTHRVREDRYQFILQRSNVHKGSGEILWTDLGFYQDLAAILNEVVRMKTISTEKLIEELARIETEMEELGRACKEKWGESP
jgi:7,8-dihydro-6-hydroxymethylpterin-pyrophosphokinase